MLVNTQNLALDDLLCRCQVLHFQSTLHFYLFLLSLFTYYVLISSSAFAKRPRNASSCMSVVSFVALILATIPRAQFFIISYFGFGFTSAYNSILFCCLQRNVEPCCHTVVVVRSKAINHLHLAVVLMSTVGLSSLFSFILRTRLAYDVSTNLELAS